METPPDRSLRALEYFGDRFPSLALQLKHHEHDSLLLGESIQGRLHPSMHRRLGKVPGGDSGGWKTAK